MRWAGEQGLNLLTGNIVTELRLELPYEFDRGDYEQILHDVRHLIAPELGWRPGNSTMPSEILNKAIPLYPKRP